ncbi:PopZ family protein [Mesorhizobium sp. M1143]|uniref:PopZ family protein n=1 Tax=Mesorhizobium sp. M1143 TaxID=2957061 RepID=UPI00333C2D0E
MATASSAQREPSMEEILASIRRIIEDSDTGRKLPGDADELRQDLVPAAGPVSDVEAFRSELHSSTESKKPVTLAEVQAQLAEPVVARLEPRSEPSPVKPAIAANATTAAPPAHAPMTLAEVSARIASEPAPAVGAEAAVRAKTETTDSIVTDWRREIAAVGNQAKPADTVRRPEIRQPEIRQPEAENRQAAIAEVEAFEDDLAAEPAFEPRPSSGEHARPADTTPARPAIVSEHTGRQVAAAFGELSDAFASRSKKTFDEMAEEMLRPMLQDWLDNNLPTLVERLVREEIERVARGAQ